MSIFASRISSQKAEKRAIRSAIFFVCLHEGHRLPHGSSISSVRSFVPSASKKGVPYEPEDYQKRRTKKKPYIRVSSETMLLSRNMDALLADFDCPGGFVSSQTHVLSLLFGRISKFGLQSFDSWVLPCSSPRFRSRLYSLITWKDDVHNSHFVK
jgi:hypothetical protein